MAGRSQPECHKGKEELNVYLRSGQEGQNFRITGKCAQVYAVSLTESLPGTKVFWSLNGALTASKGQVLVLRQELLIYIILLVFLIKILLNKASFS